MIARFGRFTLDARRRRLTEGDREIHLTPKAFELLALLAEEAPRVVAKPELHERLWPHTFVSDATLVGVVKELRRALDDRDERSPIIRTVHRVGYALSVPVMREGAPRRSGVSHWITLGARRVVLDEGDTLIGRDPAAHVRVDVSGVSRRHARIRIAGGRAVLEDLGSKNGTAVNDVPLAGAAELRDGDRIRIGPATILFHASASGPPTETVVIPGVPSRRVPGDEPSP